MRIWLQQKPSPKLGVAHTCRLRQENHSKSEVSLDYIVRLYLNKQNENRNTDISRSKRTSHVGSPEATALQHKSKKTISQKPCRAPRQESFPFCSIAWRESLPREPDFSQSENTDMNIRMEGGFPKLTDSKILWSGVLCCCSNYTASGPCEAAI